MKCLSIQIRGISTCQTASVCQLRWTTKIKVQKQCLGVCVCWCKRRIALGSFCQMWSVAYTPEAGTGGRLCESVIGAKGNAYLAKVDAHYFRQYTQLHCPGQIKNCLPDVWPMGLVLCERLCEQARRDDGWGSRGVQHACSLPSISKPLELECLAMTRNVLTKIPFNKCEWLFQMFLLRSNTL